MKAHGYTQKETVEETGLPQRQVTAVLKSL
jgi:hypothetical protein